MELKRSNYLAQYLGKVQIETTDTIPTTPSISKNCSELTPMTGKYLRQSSIVISLSPPKMFILPFTKKWTLFQTFPHKYHQLT